MIQISRFSVRGGRALSSSFKAMPVGIRPSVTLPKATSFQSLAVRSFSAVPSGENGSNGIDNVVNVGNAANDSMMEAAKVLVDEKALDAAVAVAGVATEHSNFVVRGVMDFIDSMHNFIGIPYWEAIVLTTIGLRFVLLPIALKTVQGSARMAVMRPDMQKLQDAMSKDPNAGDMNVKLRYQKEMQALFLKHKVNPLRAVMWPFVQFPVFIAFFMALKEMGTYFPGMATGGAWWFTDLTAADPYYILPLFNSISFLAMIELGGDGVQLPQQQKFKMIMRGLAVAMVPLTATMPQGLFVYWGANNVLSIIQTTVLKNENVRKYFDIPKMPAPEEAPALKVRNPLSALTEVSNNLKILLFYLFSIILHL
jgi:YidC/Oxa1 family membrane protein insertase